MRRSVLPLVAVIALALGSVPCRAEEPAADPARANEGGEALAADADYARDLRTASQNPVADLVSLPVRNKVNLGFGPRDRTGLVTTVQPVIPFELTDDVTLFVVQPLINDTLPDGWFPTSSPIVAANWEAKGGRWTVPVGRGVGRVFAIGRQPVTMPLQAFGNVVRPDDVGPDWSPRFTLSFLFPR